MFKAFFPCSDDSCGFSDPEDAYDNTAPEWVGSGTVLVIDDEDMVRDVAQMMVESFGFTVLTAKDGPDGLAIVTSGQPLDLVLLDLTMPRMTGEEVFREIQRLRPGLPIILVSGYNEQEVNDLFSGKDIAGFIQKPFQLAELREKLRSVLDK